MAQEFSFTRNEEDKQEVRLVYFIKEHAEDQDCRGPGLCRALQRQKTVGDLQTQMSSWPENNISCPVCHDIYQNPVLLPCSHSLCAACWQLWRNQKPNPDCPVCRRTCPSQDPPQNLALRNVCEAFTKERSERSSAAPSELCSLHAERLKLFCLNDQQLVCSTCRYSGCHTDHRFRPLEEAAADYRWSLQDHLRPVREKKELLSVAGENYNQALLNIELQFMDTERQIKDVFSTLQTFLQREEEARLSALRAEKQQKNQSLRTKREAVNREITALTDTIRSTEEELKAKDIAFLHNYQRSATRVQLFNPELTDHTPPALIHVEKHLNNLPFSVWEKIKITLSSTYQDPNTNLAAPRVQEDSVLYRNPPLPVSSVSYGAQLPVSSALYGAPQASHTLRSRSRFSVALPSVSELIRRYRSQLDLTLTRYLSVILFC